MTDEGVHAFLTAPAAARCEPARVARRFRGLVLGSDPSLAETTSRHLRADGIALSWSAPGRDGVAAALGDGHDVVLLDLRPPAAPALATCRELRERSALPVLAVCDAGDHAVRLQAFEAGADALLTPPFSAAELLAQLRALVRRAQGALGPSRKRLQLGELEISPRDRAATLAGRPLPLTTTEFALLLVLAERAGRVLSREQLLELIRGSAEEAFDRSIDAHVSRLRRKLGDDPRRPRLLRTVRGAGYLLAAGAA